MTDVVDTAKRRKMMANIRAKDTKPELIIRKELHKAGFRYRLHAKTISGKPDLVFPKYNAVIFVNGCFWHRHDCHLFKWPKTRIEFWTSKLTANSERDRRNIALLLKTGWRVLQIWECALKGKHRLPMEAVIDFTSSWLRSNTPCASVTGTDTKGTTSGEGTART